MEDLTDDVRFLWNDLAFDVMTYRSSVSVSPGEDVDVLVTKTCAADDESLLEPPLVPLVDALARILLMEFVAHRPHRGHSLFDGSTRNERLPVDVTVDVNARLRERLDRHRGLGRFASDALLLTDDQDLKASSLCVPEERLETRSPLELGT